MTHIQGGWCFSGLSRCQQYSLRCQRVWHTVQSALRVSCRGGNRNRGSEQRACCRDPSVGPCGRMQHCRSAGPECPSVACLEAPATLMKQIVRHGMSAAGTVALHRRTLVTVWPPVRTAATSSRETVSPAVTDKCTSPCPCSPAWSGGTVEFSAVFSTESVLACVTPVLHTSKQGGFVSPAGCRICSAVPVQSGVTGRCCRGEDR